MHRALRTLMRMHALSAGTKPGRSPQQTNGCTAGYKNIQEEQAGAFADLRNTQLDAAPTELASRKSGSRAARALSPSQSPQVHKPSGEAPAESANPQGLQGSERAQVTEVLPSAPGPVTQRPWRHACYLLPTRCACTKPRAACWRARTEQSAKQRRRHTACCSPQHTSVHRTDPQGSPGSAPCAAVRRRPAAV